MNDASGLELGRTTCLEEIIDVREVITQGISLGLSRNHTIEAETIEERSKCRDGGVETTIVFGGVRNVSGVDSVRTTGGGLRQRQATGSNAAASRAGQLSGLLGTGAGSIFWSASLNI